MNKLGIRRKFYSKRIEKEPDRTLTFTAELANSTIKLVKSGSPTAVSLQYSTNGGRTWNTYIIGNTITLANIGDSVKFRGNNTGFANGIGTSSYHKFVMTGQIASSGDITSLLNNVGGNHTLASYCFYHLFDGCAVLTKAPELPSTTLVDRCYYSMFKDCTSLTTAPSLPATTLKQYCYIEMFNGCTSLTAAPTLPATTLAKGCYSSMFQQCTSLTTVPELQATTLKDSCYSAMFRDCTSLKVSPELPATTLLTRCYANMFYGCTSLISAPDLPATTLASSCYESMFQNCTSLTTAPELPATTLANYCYHLMFKGCSNLSYIKAMFTTEPSTTYTYEWVNGVASTGTFIKNSAAAWSVTGDNGIPSGWTVQTASE